MTGNLKISAGLLVLDLLGTVLLGLGLYEIFTRAGLLEPVLAPAPAGWLLIAVGIALMLPFHKRLFAIKKTLDATDRDPD